LLAAAGAKVAVVDVVGDRARTMEKEIEASGGNAHAIEADVFVPAQAATAIEEAETGLGGPLDILVNVVGQAGWSAAIDLTEEIWEQDAKRNLFQAFFVAQAFARRSTEPRPRSIVSIASISGIGSAPGHLAYGAAKAGLMSATRTMALEWGPLGIRVNCIAPGFIQTDRTKASEADRSMMADNSALGRPGGAEEIAKAALFLVSDLASYVTGVTLPVDGGVLTNYPFPLEPWNEIQSRRS